MRFFWPTVAVEKLRLEIAMLKNVTLVVFVLGVAGCAEVVPAKPVEPFHTTFMGAEASAFKLNMASTPQGIRCILRNEDKDFTVQSVKIRLATGAGHVNIADVDVKVDPLSTVEFYIRSNGYALQRGSGIVSVDASRGAAVGDADTTVRYSNLRPEVDRPEAIAKKAPAPQPAYAPTDIGGGEAAAAPRNIHVGH